MAATHGERKEYKAHGRTEDDIHPARHFQDLYAFNRGRGCVLTADLQLQCGGRPWRADRDQSVLADGNSAQASQPIQ